MPKLFTELVNEGLFNEWASLLDWFFDEKKFDGWSPAQVGRLTKKIKKQLGIGKGNYRNDSFKNLSFSKRNSNSITIIFGPKGSEARNLIKHLRNGIAHGHSKIKKNKGIPWIELEDYNTNGQQTAYIYMPIDYIAQIHKLYVEVSKQNVVKQ